MLLQDLEGEVSEILELSGAVVRIARGGGAKGSQMDLLEKPM